MELDRLRGNDLVRVIDYMLAPISEERVSKAAGVNSAGGSFGLAFTGAMLATCRRGLPPQAARPSARDCAACSFDHAS